MTRVTKESLAAKIKTLEEVKQHYGFMSIDQEYNLSAYRMLLERFEIDDECSHDWIVMRKHKPEIGYVRKMVCNKCGRSK